MQDKEMNSFALAHGNGESGFFPTWDPTAAKPNKHLGLAMECYLYSCKSQLPLVRRALM